MTLKVPPSQMDVYRANARARTARRREVLEARRLRAWVAAHHAAARLKADFRATRVVVFGSLAEGEGTWFHERSDVDIAAWGVASADWLDAIGMLESAHAPFGSPQYNGHTSGSTISVTISTTMVSGKPTRM